MGPLTQLLENNQAWADRMTKDDPLFFSPSCRPASSGIPLDRCPTAGCRPMRSSDCTRANYSCIATSPTWSSHPTSIACPCWQYAVDILQVRHIIVCGHYGCGGVEAALSTRSLGLVDRWINNLREIERKYHGQIHSLLMEKDRNDCLCELNVKEQVANVAGTPIVQEAWKRRQPLMIHGWIYRITDGLIKDLGVSIFSGANTSSGQTAQP